MVVVDGFNFGKVTVFEFSQSTYPVESDFDQNFLSSASFLNAGIFFSFFIINLSLFLAHISRRDDTDQFAPYGEDKE